MRCLPNRGGQVFRFRLFPFTYASSAQLQAVFEVLTPACERKVFASCQDSSSVALADYFSRAAISTTHLLLDYRAFREIPRCT